MTRNGSGARWVLVLAAALACAAAAPSRAVGQDQAAAHRRPATAAAADSAAADSAAADGGRWHTPAWLFPRRDLIPFLIAAPRDPVAKGALVYADPNPTRYGPGVAGEVAVGATLPVLRLAGSDESDALVVGMEAAAFARFSFQVVERELVNTDWVFSVPVVWHRGAGWLRLRYYHTSSHIGDEYGRRFDERGVNFSRDAFDFTACARAASALALYAGGFYSVNSHPEERGLGGVHGGAELDPSHGAAWAPFTAADVQLEEGSAWSPRLAAQTGVWLPAVSGRPLRLALELIAGPSPLGQFNGRRTRQLGLALLWNP